MLGADADVFGCRDTIRELIPHVEAVEAAITKLPRAKKLKDVEHDAAVEIAVRVLRELKQLGVSTAATADPALGYISAAVQILKIIGDEIGLKLAETTWKAIIIKAKPSLPIRQ